MKEKMLLTKNQQIRAQKNHMDLPTTDFHPPENEVDFELLWRRISKIWNQFGMATYTKEIEKTDRKCNYSELTDIFAMFILVS